VLVALHDACAAQGASQDALQGHRSDIIVPSGFGNARSEGDCATAARRYRASSLAMGTTRNLPLLVVSRFQDLATVMLPASRSTSDFLSAQNQTFTLAGAATGRSA